MEQLAHLLTRAPRYDEAMLSSSVAPAVADELVTFDLLASIALAPTIASLWQELRCFGLQFGCPAMGLFDLSGSCCVAETANMSFVTQIDPAELRKDLTVSGGALIMIDNQTVAFSACGPQGIEAALVVRLAVPGRKEPSWSQHLAIAFQLAYSRYRQLAPKDSSADVNLSEREREIMLWVTRGKSNNVIGSILGISSSTVDTYMRRIFRKLDVADRTSAAMRAVAIGAIA